MKNVFFDWGVSDQYGWGIYGYNLLFWGLQSSRYRPVPLKWAPEFLCPVDPIVENVFYHAEATRPVMDVNNDILLCCAGNCGVYNSPPEGVTKIAAIFFEVQPLPVPALSYLSQLPVVIAGSTWGARYLQETGIHSRLVIQGVDTDLCRPQPKRMCRDRFVVFSGGKLELRKGHDIVVKAFSEFARKHPEALLITCWRTPWDGDKVWNTVMTSVNASGICEEFVLGDDPGVSTRAWLERNGIRSDQYISFGMFSNRQLPDILREVDVALFPNRCEGGTNLVAMEAMSCGIPCILSSNTGHLDIIREDNCLPLLIQRPVKYSCDYLGFTSQRGWGESDIDEILAALETVYAKRGPSPESIRASMLEMTWESSIDALFDCL